MTASASLEFFLLYRKKNRVSSRTGSRLEDPRKTGASGRSKLGIDDIVLLASREAPNADVRGAVSLSSSILVMREDHVKRVLERTGESGKNAILIITDGDIQRASSLAGWVYKASPFMLRRLQIEKAPSLVTQEKKKLKVKEIALK